MFILSIISLFLLYIFFIILSTSAEGALHNFTIILGCIPHRRSGGKRRFFAPDEEKCGAFLWVQKNVATQDTTKDVARLVFFAA
jgi:hypothetical protein